ncbi:MAG: chemotaxis-specific protein-glutamate methyltransferase CheB [Magnetococcales bacterium]|nr:chemotaxis-specific protein-glutamate methyltransferase CheB [Magnetococcales bacterium]
MEPIKVLIVDDSAVVRLGIRKMLATDPEIQVVGEATNGLDAITQRDKLAPDIITMDVNMPGMNGLETTAQIMSNNPVPILIVTDLDTANLAFEAISYGALDLLGKAEINPENTGQFIRKVKLLSQIKVIRHLPPRRLPSDIPTPSEPLTGGHALDWIVAVASSTGGPKALITLLNTLGSDWRAPVVVAQHIHTDFIAKLVEWLESVTPLVVCVATDQQRLLPGHVYLSPAERNLEISSQGRTVLVPPNPKEIYRPSCNALLSSVTRRYGLKSIGVILTGMGDDGVEGAKAIKAVGGHVLAQDEASCAVYGMPMAAQKAGCVDHVLPIQEIGNKIRAIVDRRAIPRALQGR